MTWVQAVIAGVVVAVAAAIGGAGAWTVQGWRKDKEISDIKRTQADARTKAATDALSDLAGAAKKINVAATGFVAVRDDLASALSVINQELKNEQKKNPLPDGCRPDAGRLRSLQSAVAATNRAAAGAGQ